MRYVFFGTPRFGADILRELIRAGLPPVGLVTNPDRPFGRTAEIAPPPTKQLLLETPRIASVTILQPEELNEQFKDALKGLAAEVFVVAAYAKILPPAIIELPPRGTIGIHPSLLPKYRGATPIQTVLLRGEEETGITLYRMDERVDHGPILAEKSVPITPYETYATLEGKLARRAATLLQETLPAYIRGVIRPMPQDDRNATVTKKFRDEDGFVDLKNDDIALIDRKLRALNPEPGVWTFGTFFRNRFPNLTPETRVKLLKGEYRGETFHLTRIHVAGRKPIPLTGFILQPKTPRP